jgi:hypothetical protein
LDAARERATVLGTEGAPLGADSADLWVFTGIRALTEVEPWHGEGVDELEGHVQAELGANPFVNLSDPP